MRHRRDRLDLGLLVQSFFRDYLVRVRGASPHTVRAYRDGLRLFFRFVADARGRPVANLVLDDLTVDRVSAFLSHLESHRHNGRATRNHRLACVQSFMRHLVRHDPARSAQYQRVLALPRNATRQGVPHYLEPDEVRALIDAVDLAAVGGVRDRALLLLLYNTGARVGEAQELRWRDVMLARPRQILLHGKGGKDRWCPLWNETARVLRRLQGRGATEQDGFVFKNARGGQLSTDGVTYILRKYAKRAADQQPSLARSRITPHVLRHSCAVALLQAGLDIVVIRDYLGHASVATTSRYLSTNLDMKRRVLDTFWKRSGLTPRRPRPWRPKGDLLAFLESL